MYYQVCESDKKLFVTFNSQKISITPRPHPTTHPPQETAESWYHQRPRRSCPNDAPHLLHKGLLAAFPNLIETRRETIARQSCVKREFKMPDDVCQQVAAILGTFFTFWVLGLYFYIMLKCCLDLRFGVQDCIVI